eukprot:gene10926-22809_t
MINRPSAPQGGPPSNQISARANAPRTSTTSEITPVKVVIALASGVGSDLILEGTMNALRKAGISDVVHVEVADPIMLPFMAQTLLQSYHVVIALALLKKDHLGSGSVAQSLVGALMQVSVQASAPIVPGIFSPDSILEAKVMIPDLSAKWANITVGFITTKFGFTPTTLPPEVPADVITGDVQSLPALIENFRASLRAHGATGIFGLARKFKIMDDDNSGSINIAEFTKALNEHKLKWTATQMKIVFDFFDKDHSGSISYEEFLRGARGDMNDRRKQLVLMAFQVLDSDKSGIVNVDDIRTKYDCSKHPDVKSGRKTTDEILTEFIYTFDGADKDGIVTPAEFCEYYNNLSVSIDLDDYFELMIRNAWHISGGHGWCENSTCRRVLVTHGDGRQTVEEIKNDIGIKSDDKATMMARLRSQGLSDISGIDLYGSMDSATPETMSSTTSTAAASSTHRAGVSVSTSASVSDPFSTASSSTPRVVPAGGSGPVRPRQYGAGKSTLQLG